MVGIAPIRLIADNHACGSNETREIVHMSRRVIACNSVRQPDHLASAEIVGQHPFGAFATERAISGEPAGQQTLLRRERAAFAVHVDRATLEHDALEPPVMSGCGSPNPLGRARGDCRSGCVIARVIVVAGPTVEAPFDRANRALATATPYQECR